MSKPGKVNALLAGSVNQRDGEEENVTAMANPLGLPFNHITLVNNVGGTSKTSNPDAPLIHIEMRVKEQHVMAMVDIGGTTYICGCENFYKMGAKV